MSKDHREIGRDMDLFMFSELAPGCPIWLPKGNILYTILQNNIRDLQKQFRYQEVRTPAIWKSDLYKTSGHWEHYADNMFYVHGSDEDVVHVLKPMNCPGHMEIFRSKQWSVRDLPLRMADQGLLHRDEASGTLGGLTRCRAFCQDDAHIFCTPDQIGAEIAQLVVMIQRVYNKIGMNVRAVLSTRPNDFMGEIGVWDRAEDNLRSALIAAHQDCTESPGDGAFYGPKIDFHVKDSLGREWQTATVQLDFQLPVRFGLAYTDHDNVRKTAVVIHRAVYGSFERFIGILLEHYQGHLPPWLAPVQYAILPVSERVNDYAYEVRDKLEARSLRVELDLSNNRLPQKIAIAQQKKIPFMVVLGEKEQNSASITVRDRDGNNKTMPDLNFYAEAAYQNDFHF
jgi:threonyl-tRNA synthetase